MDKGLGTVTWWGFSPAIDLINHMKASEIDVNRDLRILLIGGADVRHLLQTLAQHHRHVNYEGTKNTVHLYVLENNLEVYARILLLMALTLEPDCFMGLQEKTEVFAEIFGNSLVRSHTAQYIQSLANDFVKMVTDFDELNKRLPLFDLDLLKYKERDMLEGIFKLWRKPDSNIFDIEQCWDLRVRQHLGSRYDSAKGAFDWDYSMKLCDRGADIIGSSHYQRWRKNGVAFQLREGSYDVPNKTLASGMIFKVAGERSGRRGYWGDIVVSPYIAFGIECEDESFFKKANKEYVYNSEVITEYNLTRLLHELKTKEKYVPLKKVAASQSQITEIIEEEDDQQTTPNKMLKSHESVRNFLSLPGVKISFLPLNSLPNMTNKPKFTHMFDAVYFSNSMVHHLVPPIQEILSDKALLILESAKFITEITTEQYVQFAQRTAEMAKAVGCTPLNDPNPEKDCITLYKFERT